MSAEGGEAEVGSPTGLGGPLRKVRLLPLPATAVELERGQRNRLESIAPVLRRWRTDNKIVQVGDMLLLDDLEFAVVKCEPPEGPLGQDTEYFLDGAPLVCFEKVQFTAWGPESKTSDALFTECVRPMFTGDFPPYPSPGADSVRLVYQTQVIQIGDVFLQVEATEPPGLGVVTKQTEIFASWDTTPELDKVHIVPFQDTVPQAYNFDIFHDYLKPYLQTNQHRRFGSNELFMYHGVQFKVVACEPQTNGRIGKRTQIYCEGMLHPSLRNLLPPDLLNQVAQLPPGLQMLLLNTERTTREVEDIMSQRRGLFEETIDMIDKFEWPPKEVTTQQTCMICLSDFALGDDCRRLPCNHVFHGSCCLEWLRRCTDCPICKDNVDRALRQY